MKTAKERLIFPLDVPTFDHAKFLVESLSGVVGLFKVGLEMFIEAGPDIINLIQEKGEAGIFLDLKLHDIPATVQRAMQRIADLKVDMATVHCGESTTMLEAAVRGSGDKVKVLGVTVLTSVTSDDILSSGFKEEFSSPLSKLVLQRAAMAKSAGCAGVVCSGLEVEMIRTHLGKDFLIVAPGIRPTWAARADDQRRVTTPTRALGAGADYLVVGRPIRDADDPGRAARLIIEEMAAALREPGA